MGGSSGIMHWSSRDAKPAVGGRTLKCSMAFVIVAVSICFNSSICSAERVRDISRLLSYGSVPARQAVDGEVLAPHKVDAFLLTGLDPARGCGHISRDRRRDRQQTVDIAMQQVTGADRESADR